MPCYRIKKRLYKFRHNFVAYSVFQRSLFFGPLCILNVYVCKLETSILLVEYIFAANCNVCLCYFVLELKRNSCFSFFKQFLLFLQTVSSVLFCSQLTFLFLEDKPPKRASSHQGKFKAVSSAKALLSPSLKNQ